ncbi:23.6 kDa heat shock protein, mitochondrial-like isoform X1 [Hibiscus syriacus]|uniref:23.6 kDa heat shock protein, mitochondrial-like isoform X1 n=1 Tax=Hibiscus syriacus TaxID=106335 RepID=UPI0019238D0C|nr:23.6 kDa heat shock protein, mitochondrial-like isoform X1 [Hibiscus syriacus]
MASLALKRLVSSNIFNSSLRMVRPMAIASPTSRLFNSNAMREFDSDGDESEFSDDRRRVRSLSRRGDGFFSGNAFDPFSPARNLSQVLNMMNQFMENPFVAASRGIGGGLRRSWNAKETEDALNLRIDMPGLGKEDVKVSVEQNTLVIEGEAKESNEGETDGRYTSRILLPEKIYKTDQIVAEMKNGVLKVVVPKINDEERNDVIQVQIN